jgi:competence protein ComEA
MQQSFLADSLLALVLLLGANTAWAAGSIADASREITGRTQVTPNMVHGNAKHKTAASIELVNINGATRDELKKLPGIGDVEADKIIAGRPYATKAHLVTQNILARGVYENIKKMIIAKQPYKDGARNAALYKKNKY